MEPFRQPLHRTHFSRTPLDHQEPRRDFYGTRALSRARQTSAVSPRARCSRRCDEALGRAVECILTCMWSALTLDESTAAILQGLPRYAKTSNCARIPIRSLGIPVTSRSILLKGGRANADARRNEKDIANADYRLKGCTAAVTEGRHDPQLRMRNGRQRQSVTHEHVRAFANDNRPRMAIPLSAR